MVFANYSLLMTSRRRLFAGEQLRKIRKVHGHLQTEFAKLLDISPSYLSQLEHNDRPLTSKLADQLAKLFPIDWQDLSTDKTEQLAIALSEAAGDPVFSEPIHQDELMRIAEQQPAIARRFVELHEAYRATQQRLEIIDEATSLDSHSGARLPWEEVRDWFHLSNNYVDRLDRQAEQLAQAIGDERGYTGGEAMRAHLLEIYGVAVKIEPSSNLRLFDEANCILNIDSGQPPSGIRFQLAYHLAILALGETIRQIAGNAQLRTETARELLTIGLANYAAGAILMPYEGFRKAARAYRHDIDQLIQHFRVSFEQACHRLSTLQREAATGLPIFFCRVDMAGNITKRHSATRLQFARFGGACPLWIVHEAVAIPDRILVQLAETPDGERYVSMAKGLVKSSGRFDSNPRRYAVALGCEARHAREFIYADLLDVESDKSVTPIGVSCRICPRLNCEQRAYPPSDQLIRVDLLRRGIVPYEF